MKRFLLFLIFMLFCCHDAVAEADLGEMLDKVRRCSAVDECVITDEFACPLYCYIAVNKDADLNDLRAYVRAAREDIVCEACTKEPVTAVCLEDVCMKRDISKHLESSTYCEENSDCSLKQATCWPVPMNVYFDNSKLVAMQALAKCAGEKPLFSNLRCESNRCTADGFQPGNDAQALEIKPKDEAQSVICPADVRQCPNGSYIKRVGPDCKFEECP